MPTAVTTNQIADLAVTAAKLADATITKAKMAAASVGTSQLEDAAVTPPKMANGAVIQVVNTMAGAMATGTTILPSDDTIPQNTEGNEYMTLAITPTSATSKLKIEVVAVAANSAAGASVITAALFQDATANALAAMSHVAPSPAYQTHICFTHYMTAGTTSATTFKVRIGGSQAGTTTFNGQGGGRQMGGVMASSITITEIKA